ncbi:MAG: hypothetical protein ACE5KG_06370 [Nitrososphaerales archaeon]
MAGRRNGVGLLAIGIVFLPMSIALGLFEDAVGTTFFTLGIVFLVIGLGLTRANKK